MYHLFSSLIIIATTRINSSRSQKKKTCSSFSFGNEVVMKKKITSALQDPTYPDIDYTPLARDSGTYRPGKMRKYHQAALAFVAVVSLVTLLIYRHEYNKLHYILEVFNYFGQPQAKFPNCTENLSRTLVYLGEPTPSWQRLDDELYVYSSYNIDERIVRTIAFGKIDTTLKCEVLFDEELVPIAGSFSYKKIDLSPESSNLDKQKRQGYYLNCEYAEVQQRPVAVKYFKSSETDHSDVPMLSIRNLAENSNSEESAICIAPPAEKPISQVDMAAFLSLHEIIGFQHFIAYDYGIPASFNREMKNPMQWKFSYETIPWNFPFPKVDAEATKNIIEADCLHRTMNRIAFVVTLSWQDYIVLKHHRDFTGVASLIAQSDKRKIVGSRYGMSALVFCTEQEDSKQAVNADPTIFKKIHSYSNIAQKRSVDVCRPAEVLGARGLGKKQLLSQSVTVNRYQRCHSISNADLESKTVDKSILQFVKDIKNSVVFRRFAMKDVDILNTKNLETL